MAGVTRQGWPRRRKKMLLQNSAFVLVYEHKHGVDTSVYSNADKAFRGAVEIILNWIDEVADEQVRGEILRRIVANNYEGALELWGNYQNETSLTPEAISINLFPINNQVQSARALLKRAHKLAEGVPCVSEELG
jgi:hypothetical protein